MDYRVTNSWWNLKKDDWLISSTQLIRLHETTNVSLHSVQSHSTRLAAATLIHQENNMQCRRQHHHMWTLKDYKTDNKIRNTIKKRHPNKQILINVTNSIQANETFHGQNSVLCKSHHEEDQRNHRMIPVVVGNSDWKCRKFCTFGQMLSKLMNYERRGDQR